MKVKHPHSSKRNQNLTMIFNFLFFQWPQCSSFPNKNKQSRHVQTKNFTHNYHHKKILLNYLHWCLKTQRTVYNSMLRMTSLKLKWKKASNYNKRIIFKTLKLLMVVRIMIYFSPTSRSEWIQNSIWCIAKNTKSVWPLSRRNLVSTRILRNEDLTTSLGTSAAIIYFMMAC